MKIAKKRSPVVIIFTFGFFANEIFIEGFSRLLFVVDFLLGYYE